MAHYAFLDEENIVTQVIVGKDENEPDNDGNIVDWEQYYGDFVGQVCKRTSYNTVANKHLLGGTPFRGNYGQIGWYYDSELDGFVIQKGKTFEDQVLNEELLGDPVLNEDNIH